MAKQIDVQVGQQYVKVHSTRNPPPVWEVKSIHPGVIGIDHAGLMNLDDPLHKKTVSISTLLDKTHYRLVSSVGAAAQTLDLLQLHASVLRAPPTVALLRDL